MKIEMRATDKVKPYDKNPRKNDGAVGAVAKSLKEFGWRQPVVVDTDGVIVVGHTRWRAAKELGMKKIPVHVATELTPEQAKSYRLADNATAAIAEWDMELLPLELIELKDLGVDIGNLGFDDEELKAMFAPPPTEGNTDSDDVPEIPTVAMAQPGDIWVLGEHRLLCGNSTVSGDVARLMAGAKAALCATDPPYLVDYTGERPNDSGKDWSGVYHEVEIKDADGFFTATFTNVKGVLAPHAAIYCWHAHRRCGLIQKVWEGLGILDHQQVIWVKPTPVFGRVYWHFRHEPAMMGWVQGSQPEHDSDHQFNSVWEIDWEGKARFTGDHPTTKPVEIFARPMRKHTKPGDVVFEPFSGSGSQIIAAEKEGRRCRAIELEPVFIDVAVARWEAFTGKKAERMTV